MTIKTKGKKVTRQVPLAEYPSVLMIPRFYPPEILTSAARKIEDHWDEYYFLKLHQDHDKRLNKLGHRSLPSTVSAGSQMDVVAFARMLAKIAHSYATAIYGIDAFKPYLRNAILNDKSADLSRFVGGFTDNNMSLEGRKTTHVLEMYNWTKWWLPLPRILIYIQLFSLYNTPVYQVMVGRFHDPITTLSKSLLSKIRSTQTR